MITKTQKTELCILILERRLTMAEQLITAGEAATTLGVTTTIPSNKCITRAEFDELLYGTGYYDPATAPIGIYIVHTNGKVYPRANWKTSENSKAVGIGVKTSKCSFVIAPDEQTSIQWGGYGTLISGCTTTTSSATAQIDYKGKTNTDAIISQLGVYATMAMSLEMDEIISGATTQAASIPETISSENEIISDEQYQALISKQQSGETLTEAEIQQMNLYRNNQIKAQFKERYGISSDVVLNLILSEMRSQFKAMIASQAEVMMLPETEGDTQPQSPVSETDIDNMSDEGIMLLASTSSEQYAANYCRNYAFKNGAVGYQPALGELYEAYQNKSEVDACMSLIGGKALYDSSINNYGKWSSTQYVANHAWRLYWNDGNVNFNNKANSNSNHCARPFAAFQ